MARPKYITPTMVSQAAVPPGSRLIRVILLNLHSPERLRQDWERRFRRSYSTVAMRERYCDEFIALHPTTHRYNDIAGFAEVYWDGGTRILVVYYFRGLKRPAFGQMVKAHWGERITSTGFYGIPYSEESGIPNRHCNEDTKREAVIEALDRVYREGRELGFWFDLKHEIKLVQALNIRLLFSE